MNTLPLPFSIPPLPLFAFNNISWRSFHNQNSLQDPPTLWMWQGLGHTTAEYGTAAYWLLWAKKTWDMPCAQGLSDLTPEAVRPSHEVVRVRVWQGGGDGGWRAPLPRNWQQSEQRGLAVSPGSHLAHTLCPVTSCLDFPLGIKPSTKHSGGTTSWVFNSLWRLPCHVKLVSLYAFLLLICLLLGVPEELRRVRSLQGNYFFPPHKRIIIYLTCNLLLDS